MIQSQVEDGLVISKESRNILDPLVIRQKGQFLSKQKQSKAEKANGENVGATEAFDTT